MTAIPRSSFRAKCNVAEKSVLIDFSLPDAGGRCATGEKPAGSSRNDDFSTGSVNGSLSKDFHTPSLTLFLYTHPFITLPRKHEKQGRFILFCVLCSQSSCFLRLKLLRMLFSWCQIFLSDTPILGSKHFKLPTSQLVIADCTFPPPFALYDLLQALPPMPYSHPALKPYIYILKLNFPFIYLLSHYGLHRLL